MQGKYYKPQIDGLRSLAVLPVILFHAGFEFFKGGFVGVDVFFVISGYLITTLIVKDLNQNRFSLKSFYIRRSRRILPALFLITFLTIPFSIYLMNVEDLRFFSKQIISVIIFLSNFFFWKNTSYFSPNSELQPLLHTWSLGVEEQFYIFFPLLFIFIFKFYKKKIIFFISLIILISLIFSQIGGNFKIQNLNINYPFFILPFEFFWQAGSANFFLPFGRIWELLLGSILAIYTFKKNIKEKKINNLYSLVGILLILLSIIFFSQDLQYPSIFTLAPIIGTILIILFSTKSTFLYKFLTLKPLVYSGLISYSLYLWHQPLLAFNRMYFGINLTFYHTIFLILLSFVFSYFSWRYVEQPFRNKKIINDKLLIKSLLIFALSIITISFLIYSGKIKSKQEGIPKEIKKTFLLAENNGCLDTDYAHSPSNNKWFCEIGSLNKKISFAIIGDSHALSLKPAFQIAALEKGKKGILTGFSGCPGLLNIQSVRADKNIRNCKMLNEKLFNYIKKNKIKKLFLVSRWTYYTDGNYDGTNFSFISQKENLFSNKNMSRLSFVHGLKNTFKRYKELNVEVFFVHQVPLQMFSPNFIYSKSNDINKIFDYSVDHEKHKRLQSFVRNNIKILKYNNYSFKEIDFDNFFCDNNKCLIGNITSSYYFDKNHLSRNGAKSLNKEIKKYLD